MAKRVKVLRNASARVKADLEKMLERRVRDAAVSLHREWVRVLSTPGQGRTYRRGRIERAMSRKRADQMGAKYYRSSIKTRKVYAVVGYKLHRASAPGDPPAVDTGRLRSSVEFWVDGLEAAVGTGLEYARSLEYGTRHVAPRPHGRTALARFKAKWKRKNTTLGGRP